MLMEMPIIRITFLLYKNIELTGAENEMVLYIMSS